MTKTRFSEKPLDSFKILKKDDTPVSKNQLSHASKFGQEKEQHSRDSRSDVFFEYHENKLKSSLQNHISFPQTSEISKHSSLKSSVKHSHTNSKVPVDFQRLNPQLIHRNADSKEYQINIFKPDLEELLKVSGHGMFKSNKVSLKSNNMIFNMSNNYLVDSKMPPKAFHKARPSIDTNSDLGRVSHNSDLKERISATKLLFTPNKQKPLWLKRDSVSVQANEQPSETLRTEEASEDDAETSRSVIFINEKIKQMAPKYSEKKA